MTALLVDSAARRTISILLLVFGGLLTVARLVVELVWFIGSEREAGESLGIDALLAILSIAIVAILVGLVLLAVAPRMGKNFTSEGVTSWVTTYAVTTVTLLFVGVVTPFYVLRATPQDVVTVIVSNALGIGVFAITAALSGFLYYALSVGRSRRARVVHVVVALHILAIWGCSQKSDDSLFVKVLVVLLFVSGSILIASSIKRQRWLVALPTPTKVRLISGTFFGAIAAFAVFSTLAFSSNSSTTQSVALFVPSSDIVPATLNLFGSVALLRLLGAVIAALPNSGVVLRRSNEVESIMQLNRLVMETRNHDQLFSTVTRLAADVCNAHGSWVELYGPSGILTIKGEYLVRADFVQVLHTDHGFRALALDNDQPFVIQSVDDARGRRNAIAGINSVIFVPVIDEGARVGTLVVFSTVEFGLDGDDVRLLTAFGDQIRMFLEQHRLQTANAANERLQQEFRVARSIQMSLLPPRPLRNDRVDVYSVMIPAHEVGGDYYDYVHFPNGNTGIVIADVSGKGIPAALYMATLKGAVLTAMRVAEGPADLLRRLNTTLYKNMRPGIYITMSCVEFREPSATVRLARAGHVPTLVVHGQTVSSYRPNGLAIGLADASVFDATLEEIDIPIHTGDVVVLTTDGVAERRNAQMLELGLDSVVEILASTNVSTAEDVVRTLLTTLHDHGASTAPHDDLTIVAIRCSVSHNLDATAFRNVPSSLTTIP